MKKQGFTLIELLAVIVVLAIIAIIAIPIITNVIDKAKVGALKDSAYGILDAGELYLAKNMSEEIDDTIEFTCSNGKCINGDKEITYKGQIETGRIRIYSDNKIELCITDNKNSALKKVTEKEVIVETGTCKYNELSYDVSALVSKDDYDEINKKYNDLKALVDQTDITVDDVKEGKKAYSNGEIITGTYKGSRKILLGTETTYDLKTNYESYGLNENDYKNLTIDNFLVVPYSVTGNRSSYCYIGGVTTSPTLGSLGYIGTRTYSDGVLTIQVPYVNSSSAAPHINNGTVYASASTTVSFPSYVYLIY